MNEANERPTAVLFPLSPCVGGKLCSLALSNGLVYVLAPEEALETSGCDKLRKVPNFSGRTSQNVDCLKCPKISHSLLILCVVCDDDLRAGTRIESLRS